MDAYNKLKARHDELGAERVRLHGEIAGAKAAVRDAEAALRAVRDERLSLQAEIEALAAAGLAAKEAWRCKCGAVASVDEKTCPACACYTAAGKLIPKTERVQK